MKYKTSELEGDLLDAAVTMALRIKGNLRDGRAGCYLIPFDTGPSEDPKFGDIFEPSTRWDHGGPIIESEKIGLLSPEQSPSGEWYASYLHPDFNDHTGSTPLIAAMRCYVVDKLGDEVELP